jgi:cell division protein FtsI/penicillin-binding protein 2
MTKGNIIMLIALAIVAGAIYIGKAILKDDEETTSERFKAGITDRNGIDVPPGDFVKLGGDIANISDKAIRLTLDMNLQSIIEQVLEAGLQEFEAKSATCMALNPKTGEILAMITAGDENRNTFEYDYEPGSTIKPFTAAIALEEGLVSENEVFDMEGGSFTIQGRIIRDSYFIDSANLSKALEVSSSVVFAQLGKMITDSLGGTVYLEYLHDFGFGKKPGQLPLEENISSLTGAYIGIGYNLAVTPMQLKTAYSSIANNGELMKPYFVKEIRFSDGTIEQRGKTLKVREVTEKENAIVIREMLKCVVDNGTGAPAKIEGLDIAGKTGTAKKFVKGKYVNDYIASFVGMYPAETPEIVMAVIVDSPQKLIYGGPVAGNLFRKIVEQYEEGE